MLLFDGTAQLILLLELLRHERAQVLGYLHTAQFLFRKVIFLGDGSADLVLDLYDGLLALDLLFDSGCQAAHETCAFYREALITNYVVSWRFALTPRTLAPGCGR